MKEGKATNLSFKWTDLINWELVHALSRIIKVTFCVFLDCLRFLLGVSNQEKLLENCRTFLAEAFGANFTSERPYIFMNRSLMFS